MSREPVDFSRHIVVLVLKAFSFTYSREIAWYSAANVRMLFAPPGRCLRTAMMFYAHLHKSVFPRIVAHHGIPLLSGEYERCVVIDRKIAYYFPRIVSECPEPICSGNELDMYARKMFLEPTGEIFHSVLFA